MGPELAEVAATEALLISAATNLSVHGNWINERSGRGMFDQLANTDDHVYVEAFRRVLDHPLWRTLLTLAIKIGKESVLDSMAKVLDRRGSQALAETYLNSGCQYLVECASDWAAAHGYVIQQRPSRGFPQWGIF